MRHHDQSVRATAGRVGVVVPGDKTAHGVSELVHPRSVQELLGHSRLDMTNDLYTGSVPGALRDAIERLDRARERQAR